MRARIIDRNVLESFSPAEVVAYLRSQGWILQGFWKEDASVWAHEGTTEQIVVPIDESLADYPHRMAEVLGSLERLEKRSQLEIARDLVVANVDVFRLRLCSPSIDDGSVSIEEGVALFTNARDMLQAAARATVAPKAYYRSRLPIEAEGYMDRVRLGQTEHGSYVVTVLCPITPELNYDGDWAEGVGDPYERRVTSTLANAVIELGQASREAMLQSNLRSFESRIPQGVSANLCDAVARIGDLMEDGRLEFDFSWSRTRRPPKLRMNRVTISYDSFPILKEAARLLKETSWDDDFELSGPIIRLDSTNTSEGGEILVQAMVDERPRKVRMRLDADKYQMALSAHQNDQDIRCEGRLEREGRNVILKAPRRFMVEKEE